MGHIRVHLFIRGKVQGVFFRQAMKAVAIKNGVKGWVRNLKDNRVEAIIEGDETSVANVVEWSHAGPAMARVEDVEIRNEDYTGEFSNFDVLY